jgi:class 3 adenylate cyclase/YHS domain-containing protein
MRVERSFAFLDLCGFTSYTSIQGDEQATRILSSFRATLRDIASRRGVRIAKWLGDGAMLVAVEPEPLVSAVLEAERRVDDGSEPLPIRAGIVGGPVILFEGDDYIGTPVNLAARLCDAAGPRQVLAAPSFEQCCPGWVVAGDRLRMAIPGFSEPVAVVQLVRAGVGTSPVIDPVCGLMLATERALHRVGPEGHTEAFCSESCASARFGGEPMIAGEPPIEP